MRVTNHDPDSFSMAPVGITGVVPRAPTAGALLRAARESAGLSLDTVAQQLKLAPRQVIAIEVGDFAHLPGRTFVRGFVRNYARLLRIDPETVLAALEGVEVGSLDSPALQATAPTIGELPLAEHAKHGWTRWAIPLTLVAIIATAAVYEFSRGQGDSRWMPAALRGGTEPGRDAAPDAAGGTEKPLLNPTLPAPSPEPSPTSTAAPEPAAGPAGRASTAAPGSANTVPPAAAVSTDAASAAADATLVLTYRDASWTEVKDGDGRVLLSQMIAAGQVHPVTGKPPFELTIGNAADVSLSVRGKPYDLAPHTRKNVARLMVE